MGGRRCLAVGFGSWFWRFQKRRDPSRANENFDRFSGKLNRQLGFPAGFPVGKASPQSNPWQTHSGRIASPGGPRLQYPPSAPTVPTRSFAAAVRLDASILIVIRRIRQRLSRSLKISLRFADGLILRSWPAKETGFGPHAIQIPQPKRSTTNELADHGSGTRRNGYSLSRARKVVVN